MLINLEITCLISKKIKIKKKRKEKEITCLNPHFVKVQFSKRQFLADLDRKIG